MNTTKTTIRAVSATAGTAALLYLVPQRISLVSIAQSAGCPVNHTIALVDELVLRWRLDKLYIYRERGGSAD
jgi:hypothetical protein